jgi:hypothetical protein
MPPDSDGLRTIGCRLNRIVPDKTHFELIQEADAYFPSSGS